MTATPSALLTRHAPELDRPDDPELDAVLALVLAGDVPRRVGPTPVVTRRLILGAGVAAATAGAVVLPAVLRREDAEVQALQRIAATAGAQPTTALRPGSYLHLVTVENPDGHEYWITGSPGRDVYPRRLESWTAADGTIWRQDTESTGLEEFWRFDPTTDSDGTWDLRPATLAALPRDGEELLRSLRRRLAGHEPDGQAFRYLAEAIRVGYAPPAVRRALIDALSRLPVAGAERSRTQDGRPCLRVSFTSAEQDGLVSYVCFDEATAEYLESGDVVDGRVVFASVVTVRDLVREVPAEVVEKSADSPQG